METGVPFKEGEEKGEQGPGRGALLPFLSHCRGRGLVWDLRYTRKQQRLDAFGEWKAAFYDGTEEQIRKFTDNPATTKSGLSRIVGEVLRGLPGAEGTAGAGFRGGNGRKRPAERRAGPFRRDGYTYIYWEKIRTVLKFAPEMEVSITDYFGSAGALGTMDQEACKLGRLRLLSGRMPKEGGELAATEEFLSSMGIAAAPGEQAELSVCSAGGQIETRTYTVCGVLDSYGGGWVTKGYPLASAIVAEEELEAFPWKAACHVFVDIDGAVSDTIRLYGMPDETMEVISHFAFNNMAYDFNGQVDYNYIRVALVIVLLVSLLAILQIMGSQIRKRSRRVSLLKAIGATDRQVAGILFRELISVLWKAALLGTAAGTALVPAVLWIRNRAGGGRFYLKLELPLLGLGLLTGLLVVFFGALIPVERGKRIPLRGSLSPKEHKLPPLNPEKKYRRSRLTAGRSGGLFRVGTVLFLAVACTAAFIGLYLPGQELGRWTRGESSFRVLAGASIDKPYAALGLDQEFLEDLEGIPGVRSVRTLQSGYGGSQGLYISYEGLKESSLEPLRKQWNDVPYSAYEEYAKEESMALAEVRGVYSGWEENMKELSAMISEGTPDWEAFAAGEEVFVYLPEYRLRDPVHLEYEGQPIIEYNESALYSGFFDRDESLKPGAELTVTLKLREVDTSQDPTANLKRDPDYLYSYEEQFQVKVGGIIRCLPQDSRWDQEFMGSFCLIGSEQFVNRLRALRSEMEKEHGIPVMGFSQSSRESLFDTVYVEGGRDADDTTWSGIQSVAESRGLYTDGNYEEWKEGYDRAMDRAVWYVMGAVGTGFVFLCFLIQSSASRLREDGKRLGILKALGVQKSDIRKAYALRGLANGLWALAISHGALVAAALIFHKKELEKLWGQAGYGGGERLLRCVSLLSDGYSPYLHLLICLLFLLLPVIMYQLILRRELMEEPMEMIRELGQ